jgi:DNA-binding winged helix-turn-helix (wHTH) protein/TolB-like protein/Tfp pilus assembly protein PilF
VSVIISPRDKENLSVFVKIPESFLPAVLSEVESPVYDFGGFRIDGGRRLLTRNGGEPIALTPKIFDTLLYMVKSGGKLLSKDELMAEIWPDTIVEENNLNKNISVLRQVLGEKRGEHRFIVTVPGHGYRFVADVSAVGPRSKIVDVNGSEKPLEEDEQAARDETHSTATHFRRNTVIAVAVALVTIVAAGFYFWRAPSGPGTSGPQTIAVLPFKSLSSEGRNEALEIGMADALIAKLGGEEVIVRPLGSVTKYVDLSADSLDAGRDLGADVVLDGTIQTSGDKIRVAARLLRVSDGKQLWAGQFDQIYTGIFEVQDSISEKVASALRIRLSESEKKHYTKSVEAYQLYMQGRSRGVENARPETERAIGYFQQAIEADPNYALAYVALADSYRGLGTGGELPSTEYFPKAKAAAEKAIAIDNTLADAHAILGHIIFWYDWDWTAAEAEYKRALALDPYNANAHLYYAHVLSSRGQHADALAQIARARELDPTNLRINAVEGLLLLHAGQTDEALERLRKTIELAPDYRLAHSFLARALIEKGLYDEAIAESQKARDFAPLASEPIVFGSFALAKAGRTAEARSWLDTLLKLSDQRYIPPYNIALAYLGLGDREKALDYLEKAFASKDVRMVFLNVEPKWKYLRSEPRFADLVKRMKF